MYMAMIKKKFECLNLSISFFKKQITFISNRYFLISKKFTPLKIPSRSLFATMEVCMVMSNIWFKKKLRQEIPKYISSI